MSKFWSKTVHRLTPYVPGEQPHDQAYIKLNTNENPYPPSPKVLEAISNAANKNLQLYPDPCCTELNTSIAHYYDLSPNQVFSGNGSDEVLAHSFQAFFDEDKPILFPDISYSFYPVYCNLYKIAFKPIPLTDTLTISPDDYTIPNGGVVIPNPNAPTGTALGLNEIRFLLESNPSSVVLIDEAYVDFGAESSVSLINEYPNLLVVQTFSKSRSLAGLRCGFALGNRELIEGIERVKDSFNSYPLDRIAIKGAQAAIKDQDYFDETRKNIIATRDRVEVALQGMGFNTLPSSSNFLFTTHTEIKADYLYQELKKQGVLVRYFNKERISNYLRITIGTDNEMNQFLDKLSAIICVNK